MKQGERWIIFYTDGTTFCSKDGTPWDAPRMGVSSIASVRGDMADWYNVNQFDFYYYEEDKGGWLEARDQYTVMLHLLRAKYPCVLFGEMLSDAEWNREIKAIHKYCKEYKNFIIGFYDDRPPKRFK